MVSVPSLSLRVGFFCKLWIDWERKIAYCEDLLERSPRPWRATPSNYRDPRGQGVRVDNKLQGSMS
jgi:hypothetical protein